MTRPYCGYFWALLASLWVVMGSGHFIDHEVQNGFDWIDWLALPFNIGVHIYIVRLIWRP